LEGVYATQPGDWTGAEEEWDGDSWRTNGSEPTRDIEAEASAAQKAKRHRSRPASAAADGIRMPGYFRILMSCGVRFGDFNLLINKRAQI
jgi:hypothetical protein